jgi:hypothetical protein
MMNTSPTSRIVVGIGLAAVFGVGVSLFVIKAKHDEQTARNAPPPSAQKLGPDSNATQPDSQAQAGAPPPAASGGAAPADSSAPAAPAPTVAAAIPPPAPPATAPQSQEQAQGNVAKSDTGSTRHRSTKSGAKSGNDDSSNTRVASARSAPSSPPSAPSESSPSSESSAPAPAPSSAEAAPAAASEASEQTAAIPDSQITEKVKSQIAAVDPGSNVAVTTSNGVVALTGSVPNQGAAEQAREAARLVAGVKQVDASALTVINQ